MFEQKLYSTATTDWDRPVDVRAHVNHECAYALLRSTVGIVFLFFGVTKFMGGIGNFVAGLEQKFAGKLPMFLVVPFAYAIPFIELTVGLLLVSGLFNVFGLVRAGLLMMGLTFGMIIQGEAATVGHNLLYSLIIFVLLWFADHNGYSLDRLLFRSRTKYE